MSLLKLLTINWVGEVIKFLCVQTPSLYLSTFLFMYINETLSEVRRRLSGTAIQKMTCVEWRVFYDNANMVCINSDDFFCWRPFLFCSSVEKSKLYPTAVHLACINHWKIRKWQVGRSISFLSNIFINTNLMFCN